MITVGETVWVDAPNPGGVDDRAIVWGKVLTIGSNGWARVRSASGLVVVNLPVASLHGENEPVGYIVTSG